MVENDVQLIHRILSGDEAAFTTLVRKYQKSVHALAWRKIGDFHIAEEITQDTFLQVHKKLATLRNPSQFAGWLYVITNRLCIKRFKKKKSTMLSLEKTSRTAVDEASYKTYLSEQQETKAAEHRYEIVKELLKKLPESERTVITLHYLGEMTAKEIGNFLGVSANTIKSRLQRAKERLRAQNKEPWVREILGGIQFPVDFTENITRQIADLKPAPAPTTKPLLPWTAVGMTALLLVLFLGLSNRYLLRFQQPYNFEAQSEPTVEIVDAPITLNILAKPTIRNQVGHTTIPNKNIGTGLRAADITTASATTMDFPTTFSTSHWTQMNGPPGGFVFDIFETSKKTLYVNSSIGIYRLTSGTTLWTPVDINIPNGTFRVPIAEHADTLYIVTTDELLASTDDGETWNTLGTRPTGNPVELIVIDPAAHKTVTMYLALSDNGIFRSTDAGKHWTPVNNGLRRKKIYNLAAVDETIFTGTDSGLYRLNDNVWELLPLDTTRVVQDLVAFEDNLYVGTGREVEKYMRIEPSRRGRIFKSNDLGTSWTEITPKPKQGLFMATVAMAIAVKNETILARGTRLFHSADGGITWTNLGPVPNTYAYLAADANTLYKTGIYGLYRTTDAGESWHHFMDGMVGTGVQDVVAFNDTLYVQTDNDIVQSADNGKSWTTVPMAAPKRVSNLEYINQVNKGVLNSNSKFVIVGNLLYTIVSEPDNLRISYLSAGDNTFVPVQGVPIFGEKDLSTALLKEIAEAQGIYFSGNQKSDRESLYEVRLMEDHRKVGAFAVSDQTFYVEYKRKLFKWKRGEPEWKNTGLIDTGPHTDDGSKNGFKLAVSAETVYVGKRDGSLFQSLDAGESWRDITPSLPLRFNRFKEILFVGSTAYVATDRGTLTSQTGAYWRVLTDTTGEYIIANRLIVNGTTVYIAGDTGIYRLDNNRRPEKISQSVPDSVLSLAVKNNTLYIITEHRGMFQLPLEKAKNDLSRK